MSGMFRGIRSRASAQLRHAQQLWTDLQQLRTDLQDTLQRRALSAVDVGTWVAGRAAIAFAVGVVGVALLVGMLLSAALCYAAAYNWLLPDAEHRYSLVLDLSNRSHCVASTVNLDRHQRGAWWGTQLLAPAAPQQQSASGALVGVLTPGITYDVLLDVELAVAGGVQGSQDEAFFYRSGHMEAYVQLCTGGAAVPAAECHMDQDHAHFVRNGGRAGQQQQQQLKMQSGGADDSVDESQPSVDAHTTAGGDSSAQDADTLSSDPGTGATECTEDGAACSSSCAAPGVETHGAKGDAFGSDNSSAPSHASSSLPAAAAFSEEHVVLAYDYNSITTTIETMPWMAFFHEILFVFPNMLGWFVGAPNVLSSLKGRGGSSSGLSEAHSLQLVQHYAELREHPVTTVRLALKPNGVVVSHGTLVIKAQFSGFRYLMSHWFWTSAIIGVAVLFALQLAALSTFVLALVLLWYFYHAENQSCNPSSGSDGTAFGAAQTSTSADGPVAARSSVPTPQPEESVRSTSTSQNAVASGSEATTSASVTASSVPVPKRSLHPEQRTEGACAIDGRSAKSPTADALVPSHSTSPTHDDVKESSSQESKSEGAALAAAVPTSVAETKRRVQGANSLATSSGANRRGSPDSTGDKPSPLAGHNDRNDSDFSFVEVDGSGGTPRTTTPKYHAPAFPRRRRNSPSPELV